MIISVSHRTDIPAFYTEWFMHRIREQYCTTVNPCNKCVETFNLSSCGILPGKCVDSDLILRLVDIHAASEKDKSQRRECGCIRARI